MSTSRRFYGGLGHKGDMKANGRSQAGFTLIELMLSTFIGLVVTWAIAYLYINSNAIVARGDKKLGVQRDCYLASYAVVRKVRAGDSAEVPQATRLMVYKGGNLIAHFSTYGGVLYELVDGVDIARDVSSIGFTKSGSIVTMRITISRDDIYSTTTTSAKLRNAP
jgi:prepilin-type N-terminal cleavage/methylation domain-containing protein